MQYIGWKGRLDTWRRQVHHLSDTSVINLDSSEFINHGEKLKVNKFLKNKI